ncbi:MAG: 50S ribosomal protein L16 [Candidatus Omnitrophica bacterium]|nr:50S ribosomal protein L16 [Candidatus Omnitrophota bacterium]MBU1928745.1 50S ribosomal protein L16 [Candidatus Omnitrophota bacterium]MBU2034200.1 50S ribosomal protein L16 [Candidatus Omnitrophota bacterium]MBU2221145.1 50S ribosomal protein L16 [Candidatus Omnitrophota bacterium]
MPKRVKFRKLQKGQRRGIASRGSELAFGEFGLKVLANGWLKNNQIEACRVVLARQLHKGGRLWIRVFPDKSITKKPAEVRMGKGKGDIDHWVCVIKRGRILFELSGVHEEYARRCFRLIAYKLPFRAKFVTRAHK